MQGIDYAYTLQGWMKGANRTIARFDTTVTADMGNDGPNGVGVDAFNYNLYYFPNDYQPVGGVNPFDQVLESNFDFYPLYNGNVTGVGQTMPAIDQPSMVNSFRYDQLNRLTINQPNQNSLPYSLPDYDTMDEFFSYDGNGNIITSFRHGDYYNGPKDMDDLTYRYNRDGNGNLLNNKLNHINDNIEYIPDNDPHDLHDQDADNYQYDPIGNLVVDNQAGIGNVDWTVYNKIKTITKTDGPDLSYTYDAAGQRASKTTDSVTTWYIRDAQGNTMAIYDNKNGHVNWREQDLYGSSRLGMWLPNVNLADSNAQTVWDTIGHKRYELDNHLGNVLATITDKPTLDTAGTGFHFPQVTNAQEYFAFGFQIPGRNYTLNTNYRYGFNGKENDNEVKLDWDGNQIPGAQQDYGNRIYDPRVGRFLSTDPIEKSYPELTPYQFASNSPISGVDLDGQEYLSAFESRIRIDGTRVSINLANFHEITQNLWHQRDATGNWPDPAHYIGYPTEIGKLSFPIGIPEQPIQEGGGIPGNFNLDNTYGANDPAYNSASIKTKGDLLTNQGLYDQRQGHILSGASNATPGVGVTLLAINAIDWGLQEFVNFETADDRDKVYEHTSLLRNQVAVDLAIALKKGLIPKKYQNAQNLGDISNVILTGVNNTKDQGIYTVGINIVKKISKNYRTPPKTKPIFKQPTQDHTAVKKPTTPTN